jgi:hypothetical protein
MKDDEDVIGVIAVSIERVPGRGAQGSASGGEALPAIVIEIGEELGAKDLGAPWLGLHHGTLTSTR